MPRGLVLAASRPTDVDVNVRNEAFLSSSDAGGGRSPRSQASEVGVRERFDCVSHFSKGECFERIMWGPPMKTEEVSGEAA